MCNMLEDEFHFVLECTLYDVLRRSLIPKKYWFRPNMVKLINLLNTNSQTDTRNLGIYVYKAFEARNDALYRQ